MTTVSMTLPFCYVVQGKPYRSPKLHRRTVLAYQSVPLRSVRAYEAPVAVRWTTYDEHGGRLESSCSRDYRGRLYTALRLDRSKSVSPRTYEKALAGMYVTKDFGAFPPSLKEGLPRRPFLRCAADGLTWCDRDAAIASLRGSSGRALRNLHDDEVERAEASSQSYRGTLLVVDGALYSNVNAEPSWRVEDDLLEPRLNIYLSVGAMPIDAVPFRADAGAAALRFAMNRAANDRRDLSLFKHRLEILRPDTLRDQDILLCEAMLDAFRDYDVHRETTHAPPEPWQGCSTRLRQLGDSLLELARSGVCDAEEATTALARAEEMLEVLKSEWPSESYLRNEFRFCIGQALDHWLEVGKQDDARRGSSDDIEIDILQALGM